MDLDDFLVGLHFREKPMSLSTRRSYSFTVAMWAYQLWSAARTKTSLTATRRLLVTT